MKGVARVAHALEEEREDVGNARLLFGSEADNGVVVEIEKIGPKVLNTHEALAAIILRHNDNTPQKVLARLCFCDGEFVEAYNEVARLYMISSIVDG